MGDDNERLDVSADREKTESKRVTSVMDGNLFQELEEWRARRGMSRSEAVNELVGEGLSDEQWTDRVRKAQETLNRAEVVAILTAAVDPDGSVNIHIDARDGVLADTPIDVDGPAESLALGLYVLMDNYSQMIGVDVNRVLAALSEMDENIDFDNSNMGGNA